MKQLTTTNPRASRAGELSMALDEAFAALTELDAMKLEAIEARVAELVGGPTIFSGTRTHAQAEVREITSRHRLLGMLLATTNLNLAVLDRLHNRHAMGDSEWVR